METANSFNASHSKIHFYNITLYISTCITIILYKNAILLFFTLRYFGNSVPSILYIVCNINLNHKTIKN